MKKSELRQIIREEVNTVMNESKGKFDGYTVQALGVFAKGLKHGKTYKLKSAAPDMGEPTYNFMLGSKVVARFRESSVAKFLKAVEKGDKNGLMKV